MRRIDKYTVELTDTESVVKEIHDLLVDAGWAQGTAVEMILGANVPPYLRSDTPALDAVMTPEFVAYLRE